MIRRQIEQTSTIRLRYVKGMEHEPDRLGRGHCAETNMPPYFAAGNQDGRFLGLLPREGRCERGMMAISALLGAESYLLLDTWAHAKVFGAISMDPSDNWR
jgi:hypothetical protein